MVKINFFPKMHKKYTATHTTMLHNKHASMQPPWLSCLTDVEKKHSVDRHRSKNVNGKLFMHIQTIVPNVTNFLESVTYRSIDTDMYIK